MKLNWIERVFLLITAAIAAFFAIPLKADAMHIMEGYLPIEHSIVWSLVCIPFLAMGVMRLRRMVDEKKSTLILLAMSGAFIFVISSLKIPSVTGSCSHMTGTGLSAILFGVTITSVLGIIVLIFQAIMIAHGGITTLGANVFSMAIIGPAITWFLYKTGKKLKISRMTNVFVASAMGDFITYCVTSVQLAVAHPSEIGGVSASLVKFLGVFAPTQIPLIVVEGLLTVLIIICLENFAARELSDISFLEAK